MNVTNSSTMDSNPGASFRTTGPKWPSSPHDHWRLPSGQTVGETDNDTLRRELARLGIPEAHTLGRHILAERYSSMLQKIHDGAGNAAVDAFLANHRG
jgi:hypothetical protein